MCVCVGGGGGGGLVLLLFIHFLISVARSQLQCRTDISRIRLKKWHIRI